MEDKTLINTGMAFSEKILETADDIIQALLAALSEKSSMEQNHILELFAKYAKEGGNLQAVQFSLEHLEHFEAAAKKMDLSYYAVTDKRDKKATIIIKDNDSQLLERVAAHLAKDGTPLYKDPQMFVSDFLEKYKGENIVFSHIVSSIEQIDLMKMDLAEKKMEFAIGRKQDKGYLVIFLKKDYDILKRLGIIAADKEPEELFKTWDIEEVKHIVEKKRQSQEKETEKQREKKSQKR